MLLSVIRGQEGEIQIPVSTPTRSHSRFPHYSVNIVNSRFIIAVVNPLLRVTHQLLRMLTSPTFYRALGFEDPPGNHGHRHCHTLLDSPGEPLTWVPLPHLTDERTGKQCTLESEARAPGEPVFRNPSFRRTPRGTEVTGGPSPISIPPTP